MEILFHGSSNYFDVLKPYQAVDTGYKEGCQNAVYATSNRNMALAFALDSIPNADGEVERIMMPEFGDLMMYKKGTPNYGGKGYLYILNKKDFKFAMGTQWVCFHEIKPIEIIEIEVNDYLYLAQVEEKDDRIGTQPALIIL